VSEAVPPLPNTPSWRAQLKHRDNLLYFYYNITFISLWTASGPVSVVVTPDLAKCALFISFYMFPEVRGRDFQMLTQRHWQ
jgi:hypothetical protein